jgi:formylglycine-generating enzyme required for sulfatase activity
MKSILALAISLVWAVSASAITIDTVHIGNSGNANDPATGNLFGGVGYAYRIGTYEVTVGQYAAFLNAVATTDTYSLYDTFMTSDGNIAGISRSGSPGSYSYNVIGSPNHPITYVDWGDAARFANWLHNGQPNGPQGPGTTEAGSYKLNGAISQSALMAVNRDAGATWVIPTENEWYKAAYYQPAAQGGDSDSYWAYPMKTNSVPYSDQPPGATPDNTRVGNFYLDDDVANGYDEGYAVSGSSAYSSTLNYLTNVGAYSSSPSYYGTLDQGGNVREWIETRVTSSTRGWRGGFWGSFPDTLGASYRYIGNQATYEYSYIGFRLAIIPEPSTLLLTIIAFASLLTARSKPVRHNRV